MRTCLFLLILGITSITGGCISVGQSEVVGTLTNVQFNEPLPARDVIAGCAVEAFDLHKAPGQIEIHIVEVTNTIEETQRTSFDNVNVIRKASDIMAADRNGIFFLDDFGLAPALDIANNGSPDKELKAAIVKLKTGQSTVVGAWGTYSLDGVPKKNIVNTRILSKTEADLCNASICLILESGVKFGGVTDGKGRIALPLCQHPELGLIRPGNLTVTVDVNGAATAIGNIRISDEDVMSIRKRLPLAADPKFDGNGGPAPPGSL